MKSPSSEHKSSASGKGPVRLALVTVSDTRTPETDQNYFYLRDQIAQAGHEIVFYQIVKDEPFEIENILDQVIESNAQICIINGGTGISPRDRTYDVVSRRIEKSMPGFGELFRMLSFSEVGGAAMLSRAVAGLLGGKMFFSTPGSPNAVSVAWEKLIRDELEHIAWEMVK